MGRFSHIWEEFPYIGNFKEKKYYFYIPNIGNKDKIMAKYRFEETERKRVVELDDGESLNIKRNNPMKGLYEKFFIINQKFLKYVIARNLTGRQSKVLFYLLSEMHQENRIVTNGRLIGEALNIRQSHVLDELRKLEEYGIIFRTKLGMYQTEIGLNYEHVEHDMVSPLFGYKGASNTKQIETHKEKIQELTPYAEVQQLKENKIDFVDKKSGEILYSEKKIFKKTDLEEDTNVIEDNFNNKKIDKPHPHQQLSMIEEIDKQKNHE